MTFYKSFNLRRLIAPLALFLVCSMKSLAVMLNLKILMHPSSLYIAVLILSIQAKILSISVGSNQVRWRPILPLYDGISLDFDGPEYFLDTAQYFNTSVLEFDASFRYASETISWSASGYIQRQSYDNDYIFGGPVSSNNSRPTIQSESSHQAMLEYTHC